MALEKYRGRRPSVGELAIVIGAGRSGLAASRLLRRAGAKVRLLERNAGSIQPKMAEELRSLGIEVLTGEHKSEYFENAAFIVPSPAMPVAHVEKFISGENATRPEILSEMELSWRFLDNEPVLAVTGTSGKTTTASLAAAMLKMQGYSVFLGGNIGTPLSEYVLDTRKADVLVLEISSFQLQGCSTFCPRAAILLNISPNHLDYHKDMAEYIEAKFRLFRCQDEGDLAVLGESVRQVANSFPIGARKVWIQNVARFPQTGLQGVHNAINAEAAWQASRFFGVSQENAARAVAAFRPLPHRLEKVGEYKGVIYINDSKSTTVESLRVALEAMDRPVRLFCGGKFKGGDLKSLLPLVREKVAEVALFGASREHFENAWQDTVPINWFPTLAKAVEHVAENAMPGDVALLSPATSSFDLYANYQARGEDFRRLVGELG